MKRSWQSSRETPPNVDIFPRGGRESNCPIKSPEGSVPWVNYPSAAKVSPEVWSGIGNGM